MNYWDNNLHKVICDCTRVVINMQTEGGRGYLTGVSFQLRLLFENNAWHAEQPNLHFRVFENSQFAHFIGCNVKYMRNIPVINCVVLQSIVTSPILWNCERPIFRETLIKHLLTQRRVPKSVRMSHYLW